MSEVLNVEKLFGENVFTLGKMQERLPKKAFAEVKRVMEHGGELDNATADVVAKTMKDWAVEHGAHLQEFFLRSYISLSFFLKNYHRLSDNLRSCAFEIRQIVLFYHNPTISYTFFEGYFLKKHQQQRRFPRLPQYFFRLLRYFFHLLSARPDAGIALTPHPSPEHAAR